MTHERGGREDICVEEYEPVIVYSEGDIEFDDYPDLTEQHYLDYTRPWYGYSENWGDGPCWNLQDEYVRQIRKRYKEEDEERNEEERYEHTMGFRLKPHRMKKNT